MTDDDDRMDPELARYMTAIVPPYMAARARVSVIFAEYLAKAEASEDGLLAAVLEDLRDEVLAALDPVDERG